MREGLSAPAIARHLTAKRVPDTERWRGVEHEDGPVCPRSEGGCVMAHVRKVETAQRRNGKPVAHYEVRWSDPTVATDPRDRPSRPARPPAARITRRPPRRRPKPTSGCARSRTPPSVRACLPSPPAPSAQSPAPTPGSSAAQLIARGLVSANPGRPPLQARRQPHPPRSRVRALAALDGAVGSRGRRSRGLLHSRQHPSSPLTSTRW